MKLKLWVKGQLTVEDFVPCCINMIGIRALALASTKLCWYNTLALANIMFMISALGLAPLAF